MFYMSTVSAALGRGLKSFSPSEVEVTWQTTVQNHSFKAHLLSVLTLMLALLTSHSVMWASLSRLLCNLHSTVEYSGGMAKDYFDYDFKLHFKYYDR